MAGRALSSIPWGIMADKHGRKVVLYSSMYSMSVFIMLYGFSTNLMTAVLWRFLNGICNGILGPGKSLASEMCAQDDVTQAKAMSIVMSAFGFGTILGPCIGGWLAMPAQKFPHLFPPDSSFPTSLFIDYPFLVSLIDLD